MMKKCCQDSRHFFTDCIFFKSVNAVQNLLKSWRRFPNSVSYSYRDYASYPYRPAKITALYYIQDGFVSIYLHINTSIYTVYILTYIHHI